MKKTIKIGSKPIKDIQIDDLIDIALIEGVCCNMDRFGRPVCAGFDCTMFSTAVVLEFYQEKISDGVQSDKIELFFLHEDLSFHYTYRGRSSGIKRLSIESIKFLLQKGYDLPVY
ncbi:MAG: hypothetical protein LBL07_10395 [Tannerella sp.]|nr:hypothetical protein [Tannerella sp.]